MPRESDYRGDETMSVEKREPCESCGSKDNLTTHANGSVWCYTPNCKSNTERKRPVEEINPALLLGSFAPLNARRISQRTCEFFNYQVGVDNGQPVHIANYENCQQIRTKDKKFYFKGNTAGITLWGKQKWSGKGKSIVITEGQIDAMSIAEAQDCKWPVVSLPNGAQSARKALQAELDWLLGYESIILCFDSDDAGKSAVESCVDLFPPGRVKIASLSEKDANDCLTKGKYDELTRITFTAQEYRPDGIVWGDEIDVEELFKKQPRGLSLPYPILDEQIRGLKSGRIYTIYAGCVDKDTEFLTPNGWKKINEYKEGELVGGYVNGELIYQKPEKYWELPATKFYHLKTDRGVDMMLSPEHKVFYKYSGNCKTQIIEMESLFIKHRNSKNGFQGKFFTTFTFSGEGIDFNEGELRLQVAVNADGRIVKDGKDNYTQMRFTKKRKYYRLLSLLRKFDLKYDDRGINNQGQYEVIVWPKSNLKRFDSKFYNCTKEQFKIIFDEMRYWDGSTNFGLKYFSAFKEDADFIQFVGAVCGKRGSIYQDVKGYYEVTFSSNTMVGIGSGGSGVCQKNIQEVYPVNENKFCFTMPNKTWIARRNGKIFVTHNTGNGKSTSMREIALHVSKHHNEIKIANIFLEESLGFTALSYMGMNCNIPAYRIEENPNLLTSEQKEEGRKLISNMGFYRHFGSLDSKHLFNLLDYLVMGKGVKLIMLDHISLLVSGMRSESGEGERRDLDLLVTNLRSFCERTKATVVCATQLKRKEKSYSQGAEITESDARGSGAIEHISDVVFSLNVGNEEDPYSAQIKIIKNRITGFKGNADLISYNPETGRYLPKKLEQPKPDLTQENRMY